MKDKVTQCNIYWHYEMLDTKVQHCSV